MNDVTDTTITISWMVPDMPNGIITGYSLQYRRTNLNYSTTVETNNTGFTYTITGLIPDSEYVFRVRAVTVVGTGPWSNATSGITSMYMHLLLL